MINIKNSFFNNITQFNGFKYSYQILIIYAWFDGFKLKLNVPRWTYLTKQNSPAQIIQELSVPKQGSSSSSTWKHADRTGSLDSLSPSVPIGYRS